MAHYKDINKIHAQLKGEGWHIEYHQESINNTNKTRTRHSKKKCKYHYNGFCNYAHALCVGVSCGSYSEKGSKTNESKND